MTTSPTLVAKFENGDSVGVTRMTVHRPGGKLSMDRGVRLARHTYRSRMKQDPPPLVEASFKQIGAVLAEYTAEQLARAAP
jgi:hypothetical protein